MDEYVSPQWRALHDRFDALGRTVAAALNARAGEDGPGWTHQADTNAYGSAHLFHPAGWKLFIGHRRTSGHTRHRLTITGCTPDQWTGKAVDEITVADTRKPVDIAREIQNRLMPGYRVTMRQALADVAENRENARRRPERMKRLQEALPALEPYSWASDRAAGSFYSGEAAGRRSASHASGTVRVNHDGASVDLKLTGVPAHLAARILALLDANPTPLTGRVMPRPLPEALPEVPPAVRTIVGEVADGHPALPPGGSPDALTPALLLLAATAEPEQA